MNYFDKVPTNYSILLPNAMLDVRTTYMDGMEGAKELSEKNPTDYEMALDTMNKFNCCYYHCDLYVVVLYKGIEVDAIMGGEYGQDIVGIAYNPNQGEWFIPAF